MRWLPCDLLHSGYIRIGFQFHLGDPVVPYNPVKDNHRTRPGLLCSLDERPDIHVFGLDPDHCSPSSARYRRKDGNLVTVRNLDRCRILEFYPFAVPHHDDELVEITVLVKDRGNLPSSSGWDQWRAGFLLLLGEDIRPEQFPEPGKNRTFTVISSSSLIRGQASAGRAAGHPLGMDLIGTPGKPVPDEDPVGQEISRLQEILDHFGCLHRPDDPGCCPDHREDLLWRGLGEDAFQARGLSRDDGGCLTVESPDGAVEERDLLLDGNHR